MIHTALFSRLLAIVAALALGIQAQEQHGSVDSVLARANVALASGDTAAALSLLEAAEEAHEDDVRVQAELAWIHAARASDIATDFSERRTAEEYAQRALRADPQNTRALAALASVRLKQHSTIAAGKLLARAFDSPGFVQLPPALKADLYYLEGQRWAWRVSAFKDLVLPPMGLAVTSPSCLAYGVFCRAFAHPAQFNEQLEAAQPLEQVAADEKERMIAAYRQALEANPGHLPALAELLGVLAGSGTWPEYLEAARCGVEARPDAGIVHLWLGLGLHRTGETESAAVSFAKGLALLDAGESQSYTNPLILLTEDDSAEVASAAVQKDEYERVYWAKADPLYLTPSNERWVEHIARIVYADLQFASRSGRKRGSETDPGRVFLRYGPPRAIWSVARDRSKETDPLSIAKAFELMECGVAFEKSAEDYAAPDMTACQQLETQVSFSLHGGGRWIFWNYFPDRPTLVFSRNLSFTDPEFLAGSYSENYVREVRERVPSHYEHFDRVLEIEHQLVRFKGDRPDITSVETYVRFPIDELSRPSSRWTRIGLFFFDRTYREKYEWQREVPAREGSRRLLLTQDLPPGYYDYSIEAYDTLANSIATARGSLATQRYPLDTLTVSDLLVADNVAVLARPTKRREQLRISGSTDLEFESWDPVWLYWETYGLQAVDGLVRYEVSLDVRDETERSVVVTVLRAIGDLLGGRATGTTVGWTREVEVQELDRTIDWLQLGELEPGRYRIVASVRDLVSGSTARAERYIRIKKEEQ
ncbi:MAG: GWxTD domain-containing protein [Gemmatimonadetes bacterium]|nr:GWxTD domain-containing protein [Gemmatimonadota bacterium]NIV23931.1 GWxTD domain-containing protein [Gemmatimonadota bacterium]NIW36284.1 GWxTD domain-containing protein [Gemmatimonadota bacterium]